MPRMPKPHLAALDEPLEFDIKIVGRILVEIGFIIATLGLIVVGLKTFGEVMVPILFVGTIISMLVHVRYKYLQRIKQQHKY